MLLLILLAIPTYTIFTCSAHYDGLSLKCKLHFLNHCDRNCHVCESEDLNVTNSDFQLIEITGMSFHNIAYQSVVRLSINNQICRFVPKETDKFFPNLETLRIWSSELKVIKQENLKGFSELRELLVPLNHIESLDSDLFTVNKKISRIDFSWNKLKNVGLAFFSSLKIIKYANFHNNHCIDDSFKTDKSSFINKIREQCLPTLEQLKNDVILLANENENLRLVIEVKELFIKDNCKSTYHPRHKEIEFN